MIKKKLYNIIIKRFYCDKKENKNEVVDTQLKYVKKFLLFNEKFMNNDNIPNSWVAKYSSVYTFVLYYMLSWLINFYVIKFLYGQDQMLLYLYNMGPAVRGLYWISFLIVVIFWINKIYVYYYKNETKINK